MTRTLCDFRAALMVKGLLTKCIKLVCVLPYRTYTVFIDDDQVLNKENKNVKASYPTFCLHPGANQFSSGC
ncbi:hypothetical protein VIBNIAM115_1920051 [Vibrio nigripulchritudo AM115]|nr:hypothetical protein VIBNIAM115_1920051 [Vibrio nigripulchritudo AM115]